jgi:phage/plasmid-like protein (TIGR03299 family)
MRTSSSAIPQSRTLMRGLMLGDKYAKEAAEEMVGKEIGTGKSAVAALNDAGALWDVELREAFYLDPRAKAYAAQPNSFWVTRTDTDQPITGSTVSGAYQPFQNRAMGEWADLLVDLASPDHVAAVTVNGGQKVMVLIKLTASQVAFSVGQDVTPVMAVGTGHDGGTSLFASTMAFQQVCANTLHWAVPKTTASIRIRHTRSMEIQVAEAQRALNLATTWSEGFDRELEHLLETEVTYLKAAQLLEAEWPTSEDEDIQPRTRTNRVQAHNGVMAVRANIDDAFRDTGFGFMSAVTEWEQWDRTGTKLSGPERHLRAIANEKAGTDRLATRFRNRLLAPALAN